MPRPTSLRGGLSAAATFDRFRTAMLADVQEPQLRRTAVILLAAGAGLLPLMAGSAQAALQKVPTDGADTLLMLMGSALVLLMTPGLAFFYGGFTRAKNVLNTMMMSFFLMGLIGVVWVVIGYSLAFDTGFGSPFIGGLGQMWLNGVGGATGAVAGLVGITPAAGFVYMPQALLIGVASAACCFLAIQIKAKIKFDDSLDAFMVHGVGGTVGALLTGILASKALVPADYFPKSAELLESGGNLALFIAHVKAVLISYGFVGIATAVILWVVSLFCELRVSPQEEERGLDFTAHGGEAYDPMTN